MKLKLAAIVLIASVAFSCDTSFGCDLLDRMLGRAGCSSCEAPKAPSCGCGGGLMDKIMTKAAGCECGGSDMLIYDENMTLGPVGSPCAASSSDCGCSAPIADCGCGAPAPVADCGCDAAPASSCGDGGCGLFSKGHGGLGGGCGCGVVAPAPMADCGCSAPAPVADCGCDAAPASSCGDGGCGLFSNIRGNASGGCGCEAAAPVHAPVADCGCGSPAPEVSSCGCNAAVSEGQGSHCGTRGKLTLLDRLRGNRIPRTREGVVIGACNNGCNSPCPHQPTAAPAGDCGCNASVEAAPCTSCGGGEIVYGDAQSHAGGCSTCQGSTQGQIFNGGVAAPEMMDKTNAAPVVPGGSSSRNETQGVIESGVKKAMQEAARAIKGASPVVDPSAFIPSRRSTVGS